MICYNVYGAIGSIRRRDNLTNNVKVLQLNMIKIGILMPFLFLLQCFKDVYQCPGG